MPGSKSCLDEDKEMAAMKNSMQGMIATATALFAATRAMADWTYDGTTKRLSDGNGWVLKFTGSGNNLTLSGVDGDGRAGSLADHHIV